MSTGNTPPSTPLAGSAVPSIRLLLPICEYPVHLSYDANDAFLNIKLVFVPPPNGGFSVNQQNVANALTNFFNANGSVPVAFAGLNTAGLTVASVNSAPA